jgi:hypothetical protein
LQEITWIPMSARPFAVGGVPAVYITAEPASVGAPLLGALGSAMPTGEGRHEACPYVVIELRKVGSYKRTIFLDRALHET